MSKITTTEDFFTFSTHCRLSNFSEPAEPRCTYQNRLAGCGGSTCPRIAKPKNRPAPKWRTDYIVYLLEHDLEYEALITDQKWMSALEAMNPELDIRKSMEVARLWWRSDKPGEGWEHNKKGRKTRILWRRVYKNALNMRVNRVWKPRQAQRGII